uniref:Uncharacterized protein n=1 Tax=Anopheles albimanus TaxID=7167 RepID=A0A182FFU9_ANOAL
MERRSLSLVALVLLPLVLPPAAIEAHVALTFPPARKYDLDFLDNSRTKAPCGMPKARPIKLSILQQIAAKLQPGHALEETVEEKH